MSSRPLPATIAALALFSLSLASVPPAFGGPPPCGQVGATCCPSQPGPDCQPGGTCIGMTCVACGGNGEFCCGNQCDAGLTCLGDFNENLGGQGGGAAIGPITCQPCGAAGQPCCDDSCNSGLVCNPCETEAIDGQGGGAGRNFPCPPGAQGVCEPCGGMLQQCCDGGICDEGFDCGGTSMESPGQGSGAQVAPILCIPCGTLDEPCCEEQTCVGDNLLCNGAFCEACGAIGEECCANNTCPGSDGVCIEGVCEALPPAAAMTKSGLTALILTLTAIGLLWMRRAQAKI